MTGKKPEEFKAGSFLSCIRENWKEGGKPSTTLDAKQKSLIYSLHWFPEAVQEWQKGWGAKKALKAVGA